MVHILFIEGELGSSQLGTFLHGNLTGKCPPPLSHHLPFLFFCSLAPLFCLQLGSTLERLPLSQLKQSTLGPGAEAPANEN